MTWTYVGPGEDAKDEVRFLVGDTIATDPLITDEEILHAIEMWTNSYRAAAAIADALAARFAREVSHSADGQSYSASDISKHYIALADRLRIEAQRQIAKTAAPYAGGISHAEREKDDQDDDLIDHAFRSHMHDHPAKGRYDPLRPSQ
jgi:hypothetical protein